jgi:hypothetical protein
MIKIHVHIINKTLCQIFLFKSYLESLGLKKDAMLSEKNEPKKERKQWVLRCPPKREKTMGAKTPASENKR